MTRHGLVRNLVFFLHSSLRDQIFFLLPNPTTKKQSRSFNILPIINPARLPARKNHSKFKSENFWAILSTDFWCTSSRISHKSRIETSQGSRSSWRAGLLPCHGKALRKQGKQNTTKLLHLGTNFRIHHRYLIVSIVHKIPSLLMISPFRTCRFLFFWQPSWFSYHIFVMNHPSTCNFMSSIHLVVCRVRLARLDSIHRTICRLDESRSETRHNLMWCFPSST